MANVQQADAENNLAEENLWLIPADDGLDKAQDFLASRRTAEISDNS